MRYEKFPLRPGMTAIAVIALSSTTALAQEAETLAPVAITPPVVSAPTAPESAPAPAATVAPSTAPTATAPIVITPSAEELKEMNEADATAAPAAKSRAARQAPEAATTAKPVSRPAQRADTLETTAPQPPVTRPVPQPEVVPAAAPPLASAPAPTAAPAPQLEAGNDNAIIGGAAALAVLALAGGAFAVIRRRKRDDETFELPPEAMVAEPVANVSASEPQIAVRPWTGAPSKTSLATQAAVVPAEFEMSRYGPHVQAAYQGPTPENPSLSLKRRLKRARFFDQRERMAAGGTSTVEREEAVSTGAAPGVTDHFSFRPGRQPKTVFRPAFQN